jgi:hypothetical protein
VGNPHLSVGCRRRELRSSVIAVAVGISPTCRGAACRRHTASFEFPISSFDFRFWLFELQRTTPRVAA